MKLSKILYIIPALALLASCDNINEDDRLIEIDAVVPQRAVLLEEFTGQYCKNCYKGHEAIQQLKDQYGDKFIAVSIHAGPAVNAIPESESNEYFQGLKTDDGDYYADKYNIKSYPCGVLNRTTGVLDFDKWAASLLTELAKESKVEIELSATYNAETNKVEIATELKPIADLKGRLQLWIVENGIVSIQLVETDYKLDYVHNHVYRANVNGQDGESVSLSSNVFKNFEHSISVKDLWNPANLEVVAFIYDENTREVYQAAEAEVISLGL
jgi:thiol-disulfide isomerase/thioredoxin